MSENNTPPTSNNSSNPSASTSSSNQPTSDVKDKLYQVIDKVDKLENEFSDIITDHQHGREYTDEERRRLIEIIVEIMRLVDWDLITVLDDIAKRTGTRITIPSARKWANDYICPDPNVESSIKARLGCKAVTEKTTDVIPTDLYKDAKGELKSFPQHYGGSGKENIVATVRYKPNFLTLAIIREFAVSPQVLSLYNFVKNLTVRLKDGSELPLINVIFGVFDQPIDFSTFINESVIRYFNLLGVHISLRLSEDFKHALADALGSTTDIA
ncbi:MAG: hypothetical protein QXU98_14170, partial [Candidatus Parvarchaeota archaeon]